MSDVAARMRQNLKTLQRLDSEIVEVLETATHVTVYVLDQNVMAVRGVERKTNKHENTHA